MKMKSSDRQKIFVKVAGIVLIAVGFIGLLAVGMLPEDEKMPSLEDLQVISFALWGDAKEQEIAEELAETFMGKENCKVDVYCYSTENELYTNVLGQIAGGNGFDVFFVNQKVLSQLEEMDMVVPLDSVVEERQREGDEFYIIALNSGYLEGKQYALPTGIMPYMLYYNRDLLENNGIINPQKLLDGGQWNLEALLEITEKFYETSGCTGMMLLPEWWMISPFVLSEGGGWDREKEENPLDRKAKVTLEKLAEQVLQGGMAIQKAGNYEGTQERFYSGELPFILGDLEMTRMCSNVDFQWDILPFPSAEGLYDNSSFGVPLIAVGAGEKEKWAKKFVSFYISSLGQKLRLEKGECLMPSLDMVFYTSMGNVIFPEHSNYYFFAMENGYSLDSPEVSEEEKQKVTEQWKAYFR